MMTTMAALIGTLPIALGTGVSRFRSASSFGDCDRWWIGVLSDIDSLFDSSVLHLYGDMAEKAEYAE